MTALTCLYPEELPASELEPDLRLGSTACDGSSPHSETS